MQSQLKPELKQAIAPYVNKRALLTLLAPATTSFFDPLLVGAISCVGLSGPECFQILTSHYGDVLDRDILWANGLALAVIRTIPEPLFIHLLDHA